MSQTGHDQIVLVAARSRWALALAGVWLLALALRLIYLGELHGTPFFSVLIVDGRQYDAWAQRIAGGQWLGSETFYQTPLYPYLLACLYKIAGHHVLLVRVVQAVMGASSCVLLAIAGRSFFGSRVGAIAGLLLAIYPEAIFWDGLIQKSSLDLFLMTSLLAALGGFLAAPRRRWLVVTGVAMGAFMLNRENARVLYPIVILWILVYSRDQPFRRRLGWGAIVTACTAIVLLPVGLRNYVVGGNFLISTSQIGPNFYIGNRAGASGMYEPLVPNHGNPLDEREDARIVAEQAAGHPLSAAEVSDYWFTRALVDIRREPGAWFRLLGRKILLTISAGELVDTESMGEYARSSRLLRVMQWMGLGVIWPLAILGVWITRPGWRSLAILYVTATGMALAVALFYVVSRYRFPLVPVVLLFAAAALSAMPAIRNAWRHWIPGVLAAAGVTTVSYLPMAVASNTTHDNVGAQLIKDDRPRDAVPVLQSAVAIVPDDPRAHYDLGVAYERVGERELSLNEFQTATRLKPDFGEAIAALGAAHLSLAASLHQAGHSGDAIPHYEAGLALRPDYAEAHSNFALALADVGRTADAIDHFRTALRLQPANFAVHANFGELLRRLGRTTEAMQQFQDALTLARAAGRDDVASQLVAAIRGLRR